MVNIYKYITSKDVKEYLKKYDYQFSLTQSFFLINHDFSLHGFEEIKKDYMKLLVEFEYDTEFREMPLSPPAKTVKECIKESIREKKDLPIDCYEYIPIPFKPGDIVEDAECPGVPMIIMENGYEDQLKNKHRNVFFQYDNETINCYYYEEGLLYYNHIYAMDIEYYRGEKIADYWRLMLIRDLMTKRPEEYDLADYIVSSLAIAETGKVRNDYWGKYVLEQKIGEKETRKYLGGDQAKKNKEINYEKKRIQNRNNKFGMFI